MIGPEEIAGIATLFGVPEPQVTRDHLISHVLGAPEQMRVGEVLDLATDDRTLV